MIHVILFCQMLFLDTCGSFLDNLVGTTTYTSYASLAKHVSRGKRRDKSEIANAWWKRKEGKNVILVNIL